MTPGDAGRLYVSFLLLCLGLCGGVHGFVVNTATNDAVFLPWSEWTCLNTSGSCFQNRERNCSTGNVNDCHGRHSEATLCWSDCSVTTPTAVPTSSSTSSVWSTWFYGPCSATCGSGTRQGIRRCSSGTDKDCVGPSSTTDTCQTTVCGVWSSWFYGACSASCGPGTKQGIRRCSSGHEPDCKGSAFQTTVCEDQPCPVDGMWSAWSNWSKCSRSCGDDGKEYRSRSCTQPHPQHGGIDCQGSNHTTRPCPHTTLCPVDGMWSAWSNWSDCSSSCGDDGKEYRIRTCSKPHPQHGGIDCQGSYHKARTCLHPTPCPVDGMWSAWSSWSKCSSSCGDDGKEYRSRSCTQPHPQHGGADCQGSSHTSRTCQNTSLCPVDGNWSSWGSWSSCTHTCGSSGSQHRERHCNNPVPSHGGKQCHGGTHETSHCPENPLCAADVCRSHSGYAYIESGHTSLCLKFYHSTKKSWTLARSYCRHSGGDLATIYTSSTIDAAHGFTLHSLGHGDAFWIGLHGRDLSSHHSSSWYWVNSTAHFSTNRFSGRSLHEGKSDRCASVEHDGHWKADHCDELHYFLCEIPV